LGCPTTCPDPAEGSRAFFSAEGGDEVIAQGFKAITDLTNAIKASGVLPPATRVRSLAPATDAAGKGAAAVIEQTEEEEVEVPEAQIEEETDDEVEATPVNGNTPKRNYNFKKPKFLNDLEINKASKPLAEFVKEKNPTDQLDKYLVVVVWLITYMQVPEVTIDHVYTVFDILGWNGEMPTNPSIPLRDLKSKKLMLTREPDAEGYKVNFKGEQHVENMGKKASAA
jgi:hypothetical protein